MTKAEEIIEVAADTLSMFGGGAIYLDEHGNFVNVNQHPIDKYVILQKLTKLSEALARIESMAEQIK